MSPLQIFDGSKLYKMHSPGFCPDGKHHWIESLGWSECFRCDAEMSWDQAFAALQRIREEAAQAHSDECPKSSVLMEHLFPQCNCGKDKAEAIVKMEEE